MSQIRASVIMTAYNGEKYVEQQVKSILNSLGTEDELIISDDGSTDGTIQIIESIKDERLTLLNGPRKGLNANINFLLEQVNGEYIFISDQDDVWYENKVSRIIETFEQNRDIDVIHHDSLLINGNGESLNRTVYNTISFSKSLIKYIFKAHIAGSMMAMRREFIKYDIVPPKNCYDMGIACYAMRKKKLLFIDDELMCYRRHESNMSTFKRRKMSIIIMDRIRLISFILTKVLWLKKNKRRKNDGK